MLGRLPRVSPVDGELDGVAEGGVDEGRDHLVGGQVELAALLQGPGVRGRRDLGDEPDLEVADGVLALGLVLLGVAAGGELK